MRVMEFLAVFLLTFLLVVALFIAYMLYSGQDLRPNEPASMNVICNDPYILVGNDCCLDRNSNRICDKD